MFEPAWKRLVESLHAKGFESRYLDRLMDRLSTAAVQVAAKDGFKALEKELIAEMGYALRCAEDKVNLALLHVDLAQDALDDNREPARVAELEREYEARRQAAWRARWEFMVHREAIGMIEHSVLEQLYPIPPRRSAAAAAQAQ